MQLLKTENKFNIKEVEQLLLNENRFITNLLNISAIPERRTVEDEEDTDDNSPTPKPNLLNNSDKKPRAKSLHELEERLKAITSKKKLTYKEKLAKKGLKNRMKKKNKQDERNAKLKLERAAKMTLKNEVSESNSPPKHIEAINEDKKPVFNKDNKMVFSKIDFPNIGNKKTKKHEKDPERLLKKMTEEKDRLNQLEQSGDIQKVVQIKEKTAWKNALAKAHGQKVKDDPLLLKKSVHKKEQKARSSKKKWDARIERVEKTKQEKQKKRSENIQKRKKDKKVKKLKTAAKRGKIIPGF